MAINFLEEINKEDLGRTVYRDYKLFLSSKDSAYADTVIAFFVPYVREKVKAYFIGSDDDCEDIIQLILTDIYQKLKTTDYSFSSFRNYVIKGVYHSIFTYNEEVLTEKRSYSRKLIQYMNLYKTIYGEFDYNVFNYERYQFIIDLMAEKYNYSKKVLDEFFSILCSYYSLDAFCDIDKISYSEYRNNLKSPEQLYIENDLPQIEEEFQHDGIKYLKLKIGYNCEAFSSNKEIADLCNVSRESVGNEIKKAQRLYKSHYDIIQRYY